MSRMKTTYLAALCTIFLAPAAWSAVPPKPATAAATPPAAAPDTPEATITASRLGTTKSARSVARLLLLLAAT